MATTTTTFNEFTAIEEVGPGRFRSAGLPQSSGNAAQAYGGFLLAVATRAAYATAPGSYALYSLMGQYLGPTLTSAPLDCTVHATRSTKTFATRRVEVRQARPDGSMRLCLEVLADFHVREPAALLTYSAPPARAYARPGEQPTGYDDDGNDDDDGGGMRVSGLLSLTDRFFDTRPCREGVAYQNRQGALKHVRTTQDHLAPPARTAAEWQRVRDFAAMTTATTPADHAAAAAFLLDGGLAYLPLTLNHRWFDDVAACSTLDVALRFMTPDLDVGAWHLRERQSAAAGHGRSYAESRLWHDDGTLVAVMTQQGILRPPRKAAKM